MDKFTMKEYFNRFNTTEKKSNIKSPTHIFMKKLKLAEKQYHDGELVKSYIDKLKSTLIDIETASIPDFPEKTILINVSKSIIDHTSASLGLFSIYDNIFYIDSHYTNQYKQLEKKAILNVIKSPNHKQLIENLFINISGLLNIQKGDSLFKHYIYFLCNRMSFNTHLWWGYLPIRIPESTEKSISFIPSINNCAKYLYINQAPHITINNELYECNSDFFYNILQFKIPEKFKSKFDKMITLLSQRITKTFERHYPPSYTIYYNLHSIGCHIQTNTTYFLLKNTYKLAFENKTVNLIPCNNELYSKDIPSVFEPYRPTDLTDSTVLHNVVNSYYSKELYEYLYSLEECSTDTDNIDNLSTMLAMIEMTRISRRKIVVVSCSPDTIEHAKTFFKKIICAGTTNDYPLIDFEYTLTQMRKNSLSESICKLDKTKIKAIFLDHTEKKANVKAVKNIKHISSKSNMQVIIFQTAREVDYIEKLNYVHINLSDWIPPTNKYSLSPEDSLWAKLYLSIYGLHLIFKLRKSKHCFSLAQPYEKDKFDVFSEMDYEDIIKKISEDFLNRCFVSKEEAEIRKRKRLKAINSIKKSKECVDIKKSLDSKQAEVEIEKIIERTLDKNLWFATFNTDFYIYADTFLKTQYPNHIIKKYKITSKTLKRYFEKNLNYDNDKLNGEYTDKRGKRGFLLLALKDSWDNIEMELKSTSVNISEKEGNKIKEKLDYLFDVLPKTIDLRPLSSISNVEMKVRLEHSEQ